MSRKDPRAARLNSHANIRTPPAQMTEDELVDAAAARSRALILVLDRVQDPHNLGACLRSADAAGALAVVATKDNSAPLSDTARAVSCGASEHTPVVRVVNLARFMGRLKEAGVWIVGASDSASRTIFDLDLRGRVAIVIGAEEKGLRRLTAEQCDLMGSIPMRGSVECLNASAAAAVCLFEAVRQELAHSGGGRVPPSG